MIKVDNVSYSFIKLKQSDFKQRRSHLGKSSVSVRYSLICKCTVHPVKVTFSPFQIRKNVIVTMVTIIPKLFCFVVGCIAFMNSI